MRIIKFLLKPYVSIFEFIGLFIGLCLIWTTKYPLTGTVIILFTPTTNLILCETIEKLKRQ